MLKQLRRRQLPLVHHTDDSFPHLCAFKTELLANARDQLTRESTICTHSNQVNGSTRHSRSPWLNPSPRRYFLNLVMTRKHSSYFDVRFMDPYNASLDLGLYAQIGQASHHDSLPAIDLSPLESWTSELYWDTQSCNEKTTYIILYTEALRMSFHNGKTIFRMVELSILM
jgi:hypothetical protein